MYVLIRKSFQLLQKMAQIIALLVAKDPTTEMVAVWIVIHPGEISNPARWKTMHEDVINHCVPAGSKKRKKRTRFALLLLSVQKG